MALTQISTGMLASGDGTVDLNIDNGTFVVDVSTSRVGIGTASPRSILDLDGGSETQLRLQTTNSGSGASDGLLISLDSNTNAKAYIWNYENAETIFGTNNAERMRIDASGRVGIGAVAPTDGTLHVQTASAGTVAASTQADDIVIENNTEGGMTIITPDDQSARIRFTSPSTNTDVGGATIFYRQNINKMLVGTAVSGGVLSLASGAGNETMVLDASGKVGIGTSSPTELLEVNSAGASAAIEVSAGTASATTGEAKIVLRSLHSASGTTYSRSEIASVGVAGGDSDLVFRTTSDSSGPQDRMTIDDTGKTTFKGEIDLSATTKKISWRDADDTFRAGIQAVTTGGQMVGSSAANDFAIRSQSNMLFSTGGNTERMRLDSTGTMILSKSSGIFFKNSSGGANATQIQISNGGGDMRAGVESSSGGTIQTGTSAYAAVFGNQANYPTQFTTNGTTKMTINADGIVVHNGVSTYSNSVYMANNGTYTFDIPVGNEGSEGNVIEVHAMYDHYFNFGYGASLITLVGKRGVSVSRSDIKAVTTGNGGSWNVSAPNATTLRLTKTAGTYPGAGYGHIMVRFRKS